MRTINGGVVLVQNGVHLWMEFSGTLVNAAENGWPTSTYGADL